MVETNSRPFPQLWLAEQLPPTLLVWHAATFFSAVFCHQGRPLHKTVL